MRRIRLIAVLFAIVGVGAQAPRGRAKTGAGDAFSRAFATGWMLQDTNHDGLADTIRGHIVVPAQPSAAENAAAANLAARLAYGTLGLTPPLVVAAPAGAAGPAIYVGAGAVPAAEAGAARTWGFRLARGEGRVVELAPGSNDNLLVLGDAAGLTAAADAFSARAPYQWKVGGGGDELAAIAAAVNAAAPAAHADLVGLDYQAGQPGIVKAYLSASGAVTAAELRRAFAGGHLAAVHELFVLGGAAISATNPKPFHPQTFPAPPAPAARAAGRAGGAAAPGGSGAAGGRGAPGGGAAAGPAGLDLATLYTNHGLFGAGGRVPVPASLTSHLYVPAGAAGVAMANLAARMGLETTALTLPLASPAASAHLDRISEQPVVAGDSPLARAVEKKLQAEDTAAAQAAPALAPGEGELRVVDRAFGAHAALLVRGDERGAAAALDLAADHLPNVWRVGKQHTSLEDIRYDLHQFFSLHSGVGQAAAGLFFLHRWLGQIAAQAGPVSHVHAELYADLVDPKMAGFVRTQIQDELHVPATVEAASLRAGTQCCASNPDLHYSNPEFPFHQGKPVFTEDIHIPWEGTTLLNDVRGAAPKLERGQPATLIARVSEGPQERQRLAAQLRDILTQAGADPGQTRVEVLDAYKQGYSWLEDEIEPELAGRPVARLEIEAAKDVDATGLRDMYSPARWMQELYPVDEVLAKQLKIPLADIHLREINTAPAVETAEQIALADPPNDPPSPTYEVRAYDAGGRLLLARHFTVAAVMQPYSGVIRSYEDVQVETGWVRLAQGGRVVLDQRIPTDIERFWDHYQTVTLPRVYRFIMAQAHGNLRPEYVPPFDTLKMDFHLSEPNYNIGVDKERISSIEALQEDVFYATETFIDTLGDLKNGRPENYVGRIIPVMHPSADGQDGEVHIEFYGKAAPNPLVRLSWTDAQGHAHSKLRNLPVLAGAFQPRLIGARVRAGAAGVEDLLWLLPADAQRYDMAAWEKLAGRQQLERSMFTVEQAEGELRALEAMHAAGLYPDELAYPGLGRMAIELQLPRPLGVPFRTPERRVLASWRVAPPLHPRPQIATVAPIPLNPQGRPFVQWREPIGPNQSAAILARLATYPGVNVYSMGRSYLGQVIWVADLMLPSPSKLISWAKQTTLKAAIVYSARQHANEVSSTSHVERLAELLVSDPAVRAYLKQVNVVLHPIDNPDGAKLSVMEAKIMPDNLLHLGYHGALAADVSSGQADVDPVYPESRTRRLLLQQWNPDAFLNPHGYPSHEWVQPFSEYSAWVQSRDGANNGRTWWIPRGWFTSLGYQRDTTTDTHSEAVTYALRDRIVDAERQVPGLLPLEERMNARYQRWGQAFQPDNMQQPLVEGIRIYMPLKGATGPGRGGMAGPGANAAVTWDQGYTEAPDETAHGDYMKLVASAGLAYDEVHLKYLAQGKLRITRSERETAQGVTWSVVRARPILPSSEPPVPKPPDGK
ncbi:MAG TPA: M14 family zinc carboxypeptidase [Terriglobales bacterium]|nr:M14 family zinc carboxypeptidase [Terriglobales bacterium]